MTVPPVFDAPKLVILDLDGTAVAYDHETYVAPTPAVVKAVAAVTAAGVPVAVATGRSLWGALPSVSDLGMTDGLISVSHGAIEYSLGRERITRSHVIDTAAAIAAFQRADPQAAFAVERGFDGWLHTDDFQRDFHSKWLGKATVEQLAAEPTTRLVARVPSTSPYGTALRCPAAARLAETAALDASVYHVEVGFNGWLDVGAAGIDKATGAAAIANYYGVSANETIVFGDAGNDLPMFAWAGHAVAMGQALPEVRAAADEVAPPVTEDGVATVLRRWFA